jgi:hypothetical protein
MRDDEIFELLIPEYLRRLIHPSVLEEVRLRIREKELAESHSPFYYRRYLQVHADHIMDEAVRRTTVEKPSSPESANEDSD